jgi:hypothetical protein
MTRANTYQARRRRVSLASPEHLSGRSIGQHAIAAHIPILSWRPCGKFDNQEEVWCRCRQCGHSCARERQFHDPGLRLRRVGVDYILVDVCFSEQRFSYLSPLACSCNGKVFTESPGVMFTLNGVTASYARGTASTVRSRAEIRRSITQYGKRSFVIGNSTLRIIAPRSSAGTVCTEIS